MLVAVSFRGKLKCAQGEPRVQKRSKKERFNGNHFSAFGAFGRRCLLASFGMFLFKSEHWTSLVVFFSGKHCVLYYYETNQYDYNEKRHLPKPIFTNHTICPLSLSKCWIRFIKHAA